MAHSLGWRWAIARDLIRWRWAQASVTWRWHFNFATQRPHQLPTPLVVSLTSYPPRFGTLHLTLRSLLRQTVKADRTILWIAHTDLSLLPKNVTALQAAGLEIRATDDIESYKKIIPALDAYPDAFIATADDDLYYWPTWLEELLEGAGLNDRTVTCHRAHTITFDSQGNFRPYSQWIFDIRERGKLNHLFPTGIGGILYPPGILTHTPEDREAGLSLCPHGDDIWLYWIGRRNGATYRTVGHWRDFVTWQGSQEQTLWHENYLHGGNDAQIREMAARFGYPV